MIPAITEAAARGASGGGGGGGSNSSPTGGCGGSGGGGAGANCVGAAGNGTCNTGSGGGGTHVYHWKENRALTNRERARLQTFPDNFIFEGSKESVRKQIGMAVPVKGAKILFDSILKTFEGIDYPSIDGKF